MDPTPFRVAIIREFPNLSGSTFRFLAEGWDSAAIEADGLIFKFPKHEAARRALLKEAALLAKVRPNVTMPVPALSIHKGPPLFSSHEKLEGEQLLAESYRNLPEEARHRLGNDLGHFYAELHRLDMEAMKAVGAGPVEAWMAPEEVRAKAMPALPQELHGFAEKTIRAYGELASDPHGDVYGFFDGHGWNMAFDFERMKLNGIYDFADSGIGPLHRDFIYSNFISPDLTERIIGAYENRTGRPIDRARVATLTGYHRLWELAQLAHDPDQAPMMIRFVTEWASVAEEGR